MGRLSDGPYKRRLLLVSLAIIFGGSVLAALAPSYVLFLAGRALQGLTYGIVPVTIALARSYISPEKTQSAISTLSVTAAMGLGIGYPLTGIIAGLFDFRFAFWFAAAFIASAIIAIVVVVPAGRDDRAPSRPFDYTGTALLGVGLSSLLLCLAEGPAWGWRSPPTLVVATVAVTSLITWARVQLQRSHPLVNLRVFRNGDVLLANGTAIGLGAAMYIGLSISSLIAQAPPATGYGLALPVFWAGFVMLPLSVGSFTANRIVRRLARRMGMSTLLLLGASLMTAAALLIWLAHAELWEILIGMLCFGFGLGATYAAMPALIARSVAAEELGSSVSFNQVLRTVGSSFGTALAGAVLATHNTARLHPAEKLVDKTLAIAVVVCALVLTALIVQALTLRAGGTSTKH